MISGTLRVREANDRNDINTCSNGQNYSVYIFESILHSELSRLLFQIRVGRPFAFDVHRVNGLTSHRKKTRSYRNAYLNSGLKSTIC